MTETPNIHEGKELKRPKGPLVATWKRHIWDRIAIDGTPTKRKVRLSDGRTVTVSGPVTHIAEVPRTDDPQIIPEKRVRKNTSEDEAVFLPCWEMQTPRESNGYARTTAPVLGTIWAHRLSFLAYVGNIPRGALVLHDPKCISRACVNPTHLRLGDAKENAKDRDISGTTARGARHGRAKLSDRDAVAIRLCEDSIPDEMLALRFNISTDHVRKIRSGVYWKEGRR